MHVFGAAKSHWLRCGLWYFAAGNQSFVTRIMYIYSREEMAALNALYKSGDGFGSRNIMPAAGRDTCKLTAGLLHQEVTVPSTTRLINEQHNCTRQCLCLSDCTAVVHTSSHEVV